MKKKSKEDPKKFHFKANCDVVLSKVELEDVAKALAGGLNRKKAIEAEIETFRSQKKAETSAVEALIERNTLLLNTGREFRMVECRWDYIWKEGIKKGYRLDTGEVIMKETISDAERQTHIPGTLPAAPEVKA